MLPFNACVIIVPINYRLALPHSAGTFPRGKEDRSDVDPQLRQWRNTADRRTTRLPAVLGASEQRTDHWRTSANCNYLRLFGWNGKSQTSHVRSLSRLVKSQHAC